MTRCSNEYLGGLCLIVMNKMVYCKNLNEFSFFMVKYNKEIS